MVNHITFRGALVSVPAAQALQPAATPGVRVGRGHGMKLPNRFRRFSPCAAISCG